VRLPVNPIIRNILYLSALSLFIILAGYFILPDTGPGKYLNELTILTIVFLCICSISFVIFQRGQSKDPQSQTLHTLVSVSVKLLLEMVLALLWFFAAKKTSTESVFMFFVLYLSFSLFYVLVILKTLKNKSL
jgi:hypothetical protein